MNYYRNDLDRESILYELFEEMETGKAAPPRAVKNRLRFFSCSTADHKKLEGKVGKVPIATLRTVIQDAADTAINWIYKAISTLRISPRSAATIANFRTCFVKPPDWQPPWKQKSARWVDFGDLIATRLESAAKILDGGWIKYNCIENDTFCSECKGTAEYWACASYKGKYVICLGTDFWKAWKAKDYDSLATTLVHEALHIYFSTTVAHSGHSGNTYCFERYLLLVNGRTVPKIISDSCS